MWLLLVPVAYVIGTFPAAALVARASGVDIHHVGSGNPGASNVTRVLGWRRGIWVFALDALKGALATGLGLVADGRPAAYVLAAAAVVGHVFPVWQRFRGGKGVATGGGAFAVLAPLAFVILIALWFAVSRVTRMASVASITVTVLLPLAVWLVQGEWWEAVATAGLCVLVMSRHLGNIRRLVAHREPGLARRRGP